MKRIKDKILKVFFSDTWLGAILWFAAAAAMARSARLVPRIFGVRTAGDAGIRELLSVVSTMS